EGHAAVVGSDRATRPRYGRSGVDGRPGLQWRNGSAAGFGRGGDWHSGGRGRNRLRGGTAPLPIREVGVCHSRLPVSTGYGLVVTPAVSAPAMGARGGRLDIRRRLRQ